MTAPHAPGPAADPAAERSMDEARAEPRARLGSEPSGATTLPDSGRADPGFGTGPAGARSTAGARLAVIVLTFNEAANLPALIESLAPLETRIYVVDSGSTDETVEVARAAGCTVRRHRFETYAAQRNWALAALEITAPWTLCLDADERLTPELAAEIAEIVGRDDGAEGLPDGYMLRKRTIFMGRWLRWGGQYPSYHLRLFRTGKGRCEDRRYDQHFLVDGPVARTRHDYIDIVTDSLAKWTERHNRWAGLEAEEVVRGSGGTGQVRSRPFGSPIERKRFLRMGVYNRFPLFLRAFLLFFLDYVLRLGFLDGRPGLVFHVLQRFWFRFLVDARIYELRRRGTGR